MTTIAIVYHSTYGHTKLQAEAVFRGAQSVPSVNVQLYTVAEAAARLDELDSADAILFGCPTYMGSMSAGMKTFLEVAVKKWFSLAWKNKIAGASRTLPHFPATSSIRWSDSSLTRCSME